MDERLQQSQTSHVNGRIEDLYVNFTGEPVIHLDFDPKETSKSEISKAIAQAGHNTEMDKAPDEVYNELPGCCLFERY